MTSRPASVARTALLVGGLLSLSVVVGRHLAGRRRRGVDVRSRNHLGGARPVDVYGALVPAILAPLAPIDGAGEPDEHVLLAQWGCA